MHPSYGDRVARVLLVLCVASQVSLCVQCCCVSCCVPCCDLALCNVLPIALALIHAFMADMRHLCNALPIILGVLRGFVGGVGVIGRWLCGLRLVCAVCRVAKRYTVYGVVWSGTES